MHADIPFLSEILLFLVAAGLIIPLTHRIRISPVLGFLCVGLLIGPYGLGRLAGTWPVLEHVVVHDAEGVATIGELGVVFLLFAIGLELSLAQLWAMRKLVFGLGGAQVLLCGLAIGLIANAYGNPPGASIILGLCLALSSTAIVMQLLSEKLQLSTPAGRASFGILLFQDLAVVPILFLIGVFGAQTEGPVLLSALKALGMAVGVIVGILAVGRLIVRPLLRIAAASGIREQFMAAVLLLVIGTATLTAAAGLSMALGAFLAGLLFSGTEYRHQINSDIEPFKGLLLALFFISVGMSLDPYAVYSQLGLVVMSAIGLILLKAAIMVPLGRAFGLNWATSAQTALLLGEGGEFALVAVTTAMSVAVMDRDVGQFMLLVVVVTMFLTPGLELLARRTGAAVRDRFGSEEAMPQAEDMADRVVIGGFGRVGQMLARLLEDNRIAYVALDQDPELVAEHRRRGAPVYFGDASKPEVLEHLGLRQARAFAATMDQGRASEHLVGAVHRAWPDVPIFARARDPEHARRLIELGATSATPETTEASLRLSEDLLGSVGIPDDAARAIIERYRAESREWAA
ncbi:cation:proton antiporter domain-containing protein [Stakelama tenebrarum]|uniref:Potassium transporter n=1 Tax=Stakelama tenebrarum TaxID=2711215 RepID=A0A6G6Y947_9SPHN|nr:cation:proton antiporter [Sphingosinithalassobacter tenebrarum]QIG81455.1 potassium transporter [Sphingosinithalassobacter tenebrarum]